MFINGLKIIKNSKSLNKTEKKKLLKYGILEIIINSYVNLLQLPFKIFEIIFTLFYYIFYEITNVCDIIKTILFEFCNMLDNKMPQINLTRGKAREKILKEILTNKNRYDII